MTDETREAYFKWYNSQTPERQQEEQQWLADTLAFEIDRARVAELLQVDHDEVTDEQVKDYRNNSNAVLS